MLSYTVMKRLFLLAVLSSWAAATHYPLSLTDDTGHTVQLSREPQRIVSMMPSHTETLVAICLLYTSPSPRD